MNEATPAVRGPGGNFENWRERIAELRALSDRIRQVSRETEKLLYEGHDTNGPRQPSPAERIDDGIFERESFRIMLLGEFSCGKSTLINAILGKDLLPVSVNPATAFTTVLHWGEKEEALLYKGVGQEPTVVDESVVERFKEMASLKFGDDGAASEPPFTLASVAQPHPLLHGSIEIVDSAGINESPERESVTLSFLAQVDAVVIVLDAGRAFNQTEAKVFFEHVRKLGHDEVFFVVNQFDRVAEQERDALRNRCRKYLVDRGVESVDERLYFVSARNALDARIRGDQEGEAASGIRELETALEKFCLRDAARVKLVRIAEFLRLTSTELRRSLEDRNAILARTSQELSDQLRASVQTRADLDRSVEAIQVTIRQWISDMENLVAEKVADHLRKISEDIPNWKPAQGVGIRRYAWATNAKGRKRLRDSIREGYVSEFQREMQVFGTETLQPLIVKCQEELIENIDPKLRRHQEVFERLHSDFTGITQTHDEDRFLHVLTHQRRSSLSRQGKRKAVPLLARPNSMMAIGAGAGAAGFGGVAAASTTGLIALGVAMPPLGAAVLIGSVLGPVMGVAATLFAEDRLQSDVAKEFARLLRENAETSAERYANGRAAYLRESWDDVSASLSAQLRTFIAGVQHRIDSDQLDADQKQKLVNAIFDQQRVLTAVDGEITEFLRPYLPETQRVERAAP